MSSFCVQGYVVGVRHTDNYCQILIMYAAVTVITSTAEREQSPPPIQGCTALAIDSVIPLLQHKEPVMKILYIRNSFSSRLKIISHKRYLTKLKILYNIIFKTKVTLVEFLFIKNKINAIPF